MSSHIKSVSQIPQEYSQLNSEDYIAKDNLYSLYYELTSEIKGEKIEIDEEEYESNLRTTSFNQIANYIRQSIMILIQKYNPKKLEKIIPSHVDISQYELFLRQKEAKERNYIKIHFMHRLQREALENKIEEYMEMEDEFEEMKTKLKYEDGKFLENDRKDNEILIIRAENTKLKQIIQDNEVANKKQNEIILQKETLINDLNTKLSILSKKLEKTEKELNLFSNINININNNDNNSHHNNYSNSHNTSAISNNNINNRCVFCTYNNNLNEIKNNSQIKLLNLKNLKPQNRKIHNDIINPTVIAMQNNLTSKSCKSAKNLHQRNNSMNMLLDKKKVDIISKYFTNKNKKNKGYVTKPNANSGNFVIPLNISLLSNRNCLNNRKNITYRESGNVINGYIGSKSNKNKNSPKLLLEKKLNHVKKQTINSNPHLHNLCNKTSINYSKVDL